MTAAAGVQSGDVQVMFNPQGATYDHLKTLPNGMFIGGPVPFSNDISFNLKSPGLSDKRVRQAFIYAPDRPSLLSAFFPDRARLANAAMKPPGRQLGFQETAEFHYVPQRSEFQGPDGCAAAGLAGRRHQYQDHLPGHRDVRARLLSEAPVRRGVHRWHGRLLPGCAPTLRELGQYAERGGVDRGDSEQAVDWIPPGLAVTLAVLAINFVGDALRDAVNTRTIIPH